MSREEKGQSWQLTKYNFLKDYMAETEFVGLYFRGERSSVELTSDHFISLNSRITLVKKP